MNKKELDNMLNDLGVWHRIVTLEEGLKSLQSLKETNESLQKEKTRLQGTLEEKTRRIEQLQDDLSSMTKAKAASEAELSETIKSLQDDISSMTKAKADSEAKLSGTIKSLQDDISSMTKAKAASEAELSETIKSLQDDLSSMTKAKADSEAKLSGTIESLHKEIENLTKKKENLEQISEQQKDDWNDYIAEYKELLLLLYRCSAFEETFSDYGLKKEEKGNDFQSIINFVQILGSETAFASFLYNMYVYVNNKNKKPLDEDDYRFLDALNTYYKKYYVEYDVFWYPKKGETKFVKEKMRDIDEDIEKYHESFSEIYIPAVMRNAKDVLQKMLVKGE